MSAWKSSLKNECVVHHIVLSQEVCLFHESDLAVLMFLTTEEFPNLLFSSYRNLLTRKQNARLDKQNDLGWKLFGKIPLRENAQKESKKVQKVYKIHTDVCCAAYAYEPCKNIYFGGFETGKLY